MDEFTLQIERNGGTEAELEARRLLVVHLNIQHHDFITEVMRLHFYNLNRQDQDQQTQQSHYTLIKSYFMVEQKYIGI